MQNVIPAMIPSPEEDTEEEVTIQEKEKMINISYELAAEASKRSKLVAGTWAGAGALMVLSVQNLFWALLFIALKPQPLCLSSFTIEVSVASSFVSLAPVISVCISAMTTSAAADVTCCYWVCPWRVLNMLLCFIAVKSLSPSSSPLSQSPNTPSQLTDGSHFMCV